jgi:AmmeMemoRadiSam system protein A
MQQLEPSDRRTLLVLARAAVEAAARGERRPPLDDAALTPALTATAAAFVTLHERGELRGCIGLMRYDVPLWVNVCDAAAAAARDDPRFFPLAEAEVPAVEVEVSVLEPPVELSSPDGFEAGKHGIVVERGMHRALLLPQVAAEMGWDSEQMLDAVCRKAGLSGDAWREAGTRLLVFESVCFSERDLADPAGQAPTA